MEKGGRWVHHCRCGQGPNSSHHMVAYSSLQGQLLSAWAYILPKRAIFTSNGSYFYSKMLEVGYHVSCIKEIFKNFPLCTAILFQIISWAPAPMSLSSFLIPSLQPCFLLHLLPYPWDFHALSPLFLTDGIYLLEKEVQVARGQDISLREHESSFRANDLHKTNWAWPLGSESPFTCIRVCCKPEVTALLEARVRQRERKGRNGT